MDQKRTKNCQKCFFLNIVESYIVGKLMESWIGCLQILFKIFIFWQNGPNGLKMTKHMHAHAHNTVSSAGTACLGFLTYFSILFILFSFLFLFFFFFFFSFLFLFAGGHLSLLVYSTIFIYQFHLFIFGAKGNVLMIDPPQCDSMS